MARKLRIYYPGAIYHIIVRGNNREAVLRDPNDKAKYLSYVKKYKDKFIPIICLCIHWIITLTY